MRIDDLARQAGTTTRTIREHQTRGLLHPPRLEGRVGYYDESHLARLRVVASLQERGYSIASIRELLEGWTQGADVERMLGFGEAMLARFSEERPEVLSREQVVGLAPLLKDEDSFRRAVKAGAVTPHPDGYVVRSVRLLQIGTELVVTGIPLEEALDVATSMRRRLHAIAEQFVALFDRNVWTPFARRGQPAAMWPEVNDALTRLRPRAREVVDIILAQEMEEEVAKVGLESARRMRDSAARRRGTGTATARRR
jgi:DNA-binding transcriptional MerR regulator